MKKTTFIIIALLTMASFAFAGNSDAGKNAYTFLKIGVGAKEESMAGAYVGLADDPSSLNNNPAGLAAPIYDLQAPRDYYIEQAEGEIGYEPDIKLIETKQNRFFATYMNYIADIQTGYLGYVRKLDDRSTVGASLQYQDYGSMEKRNSLGESLGDFSSFDMAFGITYSKRINQKLTLGVTGKFILEKIDTLTSDAMAVDIGGLYRFDHGRTSLGIAGRNLGSQLKGFTKSHKDPLPAMFDFGLSHSLRGMPLTVNADITIPTDNQVFFAIGGQFESFRPFFLRLGWSSAGQDYKTDSDNDNLGGFAAGFGYKYTDYNIDYSLSSYADLGNVHRLSMSVDF